MMMKFRGMIMRSNFRRSKVEFFRRSKEQLGDQKFFHIFPYFQEIKSQKSIIFDFRSPEKFVSHKINQEIKSLKTFFLTFNLLIVVVSTKFFSRLKVKKALFSTFNLLLVLVCQSQVRSRDHKFLKHWWLIIRFKNQPQVQLYKLKYF